jgi:probable rRNA maturation factor
MRIILEILIEDDNWINQKFVSKQYLKKVLNSTLKALNWICIPTKITTCILLTHNSKMQELNYSFLGINKPTNVLAFPSENRDPKTLLMSPIKHLEIGELALGYEILKEESIEYQLDIKDHFTHLIIHGVLHTLGFDHQNEQDTQTMFALEDIVLAELEIKRCIRSS